MSIHLSNAPAPKAQVHRDLDIIPALSFGRAAGWTAAPAMS